MSRHFTGAAVGFIGLGNMGGRMTARIVQAGIPVLGFDPVAGKAAEAGASPAESVAAAVASSDVVLMSLPDSRIVEAVLLGAGSAVEAMTPGQVIVDLSTSDPASTQRIAALVAERGVTYIDAGISGGAAAADKGQLTLMVGGDATIVAELDWLLSSFSSTVHVLGPAGAGHTTKVLNNFLNAVTLAATAEVMVAAKKAGLPLDILLEVLNSSSGVSFATQKRFPFIIEGDYLEGGLSTRLMTKDVLLYIDLLGREGVPSLNAAGPLASFGLASALGYGEQISNRVVDAIGDVAGGVRLHGEIAAKTP